jgi:RimJ/RimL family protein N-acetyltransferase
LKEIFDDFEELSKKQILVYPIHPRTKNNLEKLGYLEKVQENPNIILDEPLGYLEFTCLMANSKYLVTDSGGLQEESTALDIPCFTLRENTERPSTLIENYGTNQMIHRISEIELKECKGSMDLWDGKSSMKIKAILIDTSEYTQGIHMDIIVLGGTNDKNGKLSDFTQKRIDKCYEMLPEFIENDITIHFSGGFNAAFNDTNIAHSKICMHYFEELEYNHYNIKKMLHVHNNNTVEEAIYFGQYFQNSNSNIIIITNDWHIPRVKYLFGKTFEYYNIINYECVNITSVILDETIIQDELHKVKELTENPYGIWKKWLMNHYYDKFLNLRLIEKSDYDGKIIVNLRNENNEFFFNNNKFEWNSFKEIFYAKYFSNEIPPFFICLKDEIVGFVGCKTIEKDINDIGIMFFKQFQNRGLGKISLNKFLKIYTTEYYTENKTIISQILKINIGSFKIFISNNFKLDEIKTTNETYFLTF